MIKFCVTILIIVFLKDLASRRSQDMTFDVDPAAKWLLSTCVYLQPATPFTRKIVARSQYGVQVTCQIRSKCLTSYTYNSQINGFRTLTLVFVDRNTFEDIFSNNSNKMVSTITHWNLENDSNLKTSGNAHLSSLVDVTHDISHDEVDNIDYHFEAVRLQSFENWPITYIEPEKLAAAGFYYTGESDRVKCFECQVEICKWVEGDIPMVDHQRWSARCRFIRKLNCGNVPIGVDPSTVVRPRPRSRDVCGPYGLEYRPTSGPDDHNFSMELQLANTAKLGCLGLGRTKEPVHPEYASYDARLHTFVTWPKSMPQTKEQLADAGFFYTGKGDQTLCYHCGGGLKDWEPEDDPWEQHARLFSKCCYILIVQGQDYVNKITGQHISPPSKEETIQMNLPSFIQKVQPTSVEIKRKEETKSNPGSSSQNSDIWGIVSNTEPIKRSLESKSAENPSDIKTQNTKPTDDARMCKICYNGELGVVFLPCGHIVACVKCAPGMMICAVCRGPVTMTVRAFIP